MKRLLKRILLFVSLFLMIRYAVTTPGLLHALGTGVWLLAQKVEFSAHHAQPSDASSSIIGKPTISAQQINTILDAYHSPAAGLGQDIYTLGVQYGIDPVHVLAIFLHESRMGTTGEATKPCHRGMNDASRIGHASMAVMHKCIAGRMGLHISTRSCFTAMSRVQ